MGDKKLWGYIRASDINQGPIVAGLTQLEGEGRGRWGGGGRNLDPLSFIRTKYPTPFPPPPATSTDLEQLAAQIYRWAGAMRQSLA